MERPIAAGRLLQVNVSGGGVPKLPVESAWVGEFGLRTDAHDELTLHGGPHKAVCLFAIEVVERLQSEGHPVEAGSVGENLTTSGIEWSLLPVGTRARIGDGLEIELASPAMPCVTQRHNFSDGRFSRISIDLHPSDSRMYARVLHEGEVRPGDEITVLPVAADSRAADEMLLKRLDRAEAKSSIAAWRAAESAGFEIRILDDGDISAAAAPGIYGPAFNHASGLARYPNLLEMVTRFYDKQGCAGWLITDRAPWADAERGLVVGVFAATPEEVQHVDAPDGVEIRLIGPSETDAAMTVYDAAGSIGILHPTGPNPWPDVYRVLAGTAHRFLLLAEMDGQPVGVASLHTSAGAGWLRGAAVVPHARGRGIQRALISARVRLAAEHGCDLVGAWAELDGVSSANLERAGLRQVGTRKHYLYTPPGTEPPAQPA